MFKNATFKLTVSYLLVVMVISLVFSAVVYRVGSDNLAFGLNRLSTELSTEFPVFSGTRLTRPNPADLSAGRRHLLDELILTNLAVLIGAGFVSYMLAQETLKPIEAAHEQQKRFTADVSHELRTPLTALKMESEVALMDDQLSTDQLRGVISSNIEEAAKLENLINNLLKLTRLEAGELQQQFVGVKLSGVIDEALFQIKPTADKRHIKLQTGKARNYSVIGDRDSLLQLLIILLDNAVKYSPSKTVINVTLSKNQSDNSVDLVVEDHGQGIPAKDLERIFERFYRSNNTHSNGSGGFGLGLSIAKLIADLHQAEITITSQLHKGTTVRVRFFKQS